MKNCKNVYFVHDDGSAELLIDSEKVLIDAVYVEQLSAYQWSIGTHGYATSGCGKDQILMHRFIAGAENDSQVDHINHNRLDNRRSNLRIVTPQQNRFNSGIQSNNTSGYKGVCLTSSGKWQAQIVRDGKAIYLGLFDNAEAAARAYDTAAMTIFGEYASPNMSGGASPLPEISRRKKLTFEQVKTIRSMYAEGYSKRQLADIFSHSYTAISRIVNNKTFREEAPV